MLRVCHDGDGEGEREETESTPTYHTRFSEVYMLIKK